MSPIAINPRATDGKGRDPEAAREVANMSGDRQLLIRQWRPCLEDAQMFHDVMAEATLRPDIGSRSSSRTRRWALLLSVQACVEERSAGDLL